MLAKGLAKWTCNNTEIMQLSADLCEDPDTAFEKAVEKQVEALDSNDLLSGMSSEEKTCLAQQRASSIHNALQDIERGFLPLNSGPITSIYRGGALSEGEFENRFSIGRELDFQHVTACTMSSNFVPLFYAKKQYDNLQGTGAEIVAFMLEIQLNSDTAPKLHWTGHVKGTYEITTYRWQLELLAPKGLQYCVVSVERITPDGKPKLFRVTAKEVG